MTIDEIKHLIDTDPNFIYSKRFNNSLEELVDRYPEGAPNKVIAQALLMTEEDVESLYQEVVEKLRESMKADV